jgi:hypothetical protein
MPTEIARTSHAVSLSVIDASPPRPSPSTHPVMTWVSGWRVRESAHHRERPRTIEVARDMPPLPYATARTYVVPAGGMRRKRPQSVILIE